MAADRLHAKQSRSVFRHHKPSDYRPAGKSYKPNTYKLK